LTLAQRLAIVRAMRDALRTVAAVRLAVPTRNSVLVGTIAVAADDE
jgi:hypothetical protein